MEGEQRKELQGAPNPGRNLRSPKPNELGRRRGSERAGTYPVHTAKKRMAKPQTAQLAFPWMERTQDGRGGHVGALGEGLETWASAGEPEIPRTAK